MQVTGIDWTREDITSRPSTRGAKNLVWLGRGKHDTPNSVNISHDLCEKANLNVGDTVWLYSCGNLFMIKKEPSDFALKLNGTTLRICSMDFAAHLKPHINGNRFTAWVDNGAVLFKPEEK